MTEKWPWVFHFWTATHRLSIAVSLSEISPICTFFLTETNPIILVKDLYFKHHIQDEVIEGIFS